MRVRYLRYLLNKKGISTNYLAKKIGISASNLNRKINGNVRFLDRDIAIILKELNMPYEEVFKDDILVNVTIGDHIYFVNENTADVITEILEKQSVS